jgi:dolichol-phosphate mannosyltransferase
MPAVPLFSELDWALVVPMANEEAEFPAFISAVRQMLDRLGSGVVYLVVDEVSRDRTCELCEELSAQDGRFVTVWAPENRNVVDAYLRGYREALAGGHEHIIEMDAGLSHDPAVLPVFLQHLADGYECVYGSRFLPTEDKSEWVTQRRVLSQGGTLLANLLLGTSLHDMTSGYQGFQRAVVERFAAYPLLSRAHFYQTELRYLLRRFRSIEVPITYRAPSPSVSRGAIINSFQVLFYYFWRRLSARQVAL